MATDKPQKKPKPAAENISQRRHYDSPIRRQRTAETQERIVTAGAALVHQFKAWDWTNLTARAVGERAGVSERTVHRYFPTERKLRDAVIQRLVLESGVALDELRLSEFAKITQLMFSYLSSFAAESTTTPVVDPTFATVDQLRRDALLAAVAKATPTWSEAERENAAAVLDILWNLPPYERLIQAWGFDSKRAIDLITWLIDLIREAIKNGKHPLID